MIDSYWAMVLDNMSEIAEVVMIVCVVFWVASMAIMWISYYWSRGNKDSFEWKVFNKAKISSLRFLIIGIIAALVLIFTPNKAYYYDKLLEEYKSNIELSE